MAQRHLTAVNEYNESLYGVLIERRESKSEYCIVFMHGLSSNILEGSTLIDKLLQTLPYSALTSVAVGRVKTQPILLNSRNSSTSLKNADFST